MSDQSFLKLVPDGGFEMAKARKELGLLFDELLSPDLDTVEEALEFYDDPDKSFKRLGVVGAQIWFNDKKDVTFRNEMLELLEREMETNIDCAPSEMHTDKLSEDDEEYQTAIYINFGDPDIAKLAELFASIKVHKDGKVHMQNFFDVQIMNYNMRQVVSGMKDYIKQELNKGSN